MLYFIYLIREVEPMNSSNFFIEVLFWIGIILALIGGVMIVASFQIFKKKVMKTPIHEKIEIESKKIRFPEAIYF